jgi:hypothetical protein
MSICRHSGSGGIGSAISHIRSAMPSPCSADTASGSPRPSENASIAALAPPRPSALLATTSTGQFCRRSQAAKWLSAGVIPARASTTNTTRSAPATAASLLARMRPYSESGALSSSPAVSTSRTIRPRNCASASLRSRVTPGVSLTIADRRPARRLNSVLLPTFGRPAMTTVGSMRQNLEKRPGRSLKPSSKPAPTTPAAAAPPRALVDSHLSHFVRLRSGVAAGPRAPERGKTASDGCPCLTSPFLTSPCLTRTFAFHL